MASMQGPPPIWLVEAVVNDVLKELGAIDLSPDSDMSKVSCCCKVCVVKSLTKHFERRMA